MPSTALCFAYTGLNGQPSLWSYITTVSLHSLTLNSTGISEFLECTNSCHRALAHAMFIPCLLSLCFSFPVIFRSLLNCYLHQKAGNYSREVDQFLCLYNLCPLIQFLMQEKSIIHWNTASTVKLWVTWLLAKQKQHHLGGDLIRIRAHVRKKNEWTVSLYPWWHRLLECQSYKDMSTQKLGRGHIALGRGQFLWTFWQYLITLSQKTQLTHAWIPEPREGGVIKSFCVQSWFVGICFAAIETE